MAATQAAATVSSLQQLPGSPSPPAFILCLLLARFRRGQQQQIAVLVATKEKQTDRGIFPP